MSQETYSGRYFRTCQNDIKNSPGWFGKICLLGLIMFIPVFGQMTTLGYAYEWAHKASWGVNDPMPKKIYGRPGSKMLRWGWFAFVIMVVFALVPAIVQSIGNSMSAAGNATIISTARGVMTTGGNPALMGIGGIISLIGGVGIIAAQFFSWAATIRMTMYDRLGTGFQLGKVWAMVKHDFVGLLRIFGMQLLISIIVGLILGLIASIFIGIVVGATVMPLAMTAGAHGISDTAALGYILTAVAAALPILLVVAYVAFVANAWLQLLVARAVGYWCKQFDVASWGTKDDPLPPLTPPAQPGPTPTSPVAGEPGPVPTAGVEPGPVPPAQAQAAEEQPAAPDPATIVIEDAPAPQAEAVVEEVMAEEVPADDPMTVIEVEEIAEETPGDKEES